MDKTIVEQRIQEIFNKYPDDSVFFWYNPIIDNYIGRLEKPGDVVYNRDKENVLENIFNTHVDHIGEIVIFLESDIAGIPDTCTPVFTGENWSDVWDVME